MDGGMAQNGKSAGSEKLNSQVLHPPNCRSFVQKSPPPLPPQKKFRRINSWLNSIRNFLNGLYILSSVSDARLFAYYFSEYCNHYKSLLNSISTSNSPIWVTTTTTTLVCIFSLILNCNKANHSFLSPKKKNH